MYGSLLSHLKLWFAKFIFFFFRHKQHIKHNIGTDSKIDLPTEDPQENANNFYDIEMVLDDQLYEGDLKDIKEGGFVSFRYTGTTFGPPVNPKVSIHCYFIFLLFTLPQSSDL